MWLPFAAEASWITGKFDLLATFVGQNNTTDRSSFSVDLGRILLELSSQESTTTTELLDHLRQSTARSLSRSNTSSLQNCHESMLKFHALADLEAIHNHSQSTNPNKSALFMSLNKRINVLGPFNADKQYLLGIRRAAMQRLK